MEKRKLVNTINSNRTLSTFKESIIARTGPPANQSRNIIKKLASQKLSSRRDSLPQQHPYKETALGVKDLYYSHFVAGRPGRAFALNKHASKGVE